MSASSPQPSGLSPQVSSILDLTIPFLPYWLTYHLEFYIYERNALALGLLAIFGAGAVAGLQPEWKAVSLALLVAGKK